MAKEMKTRKELADLVLRETRASGKWADLHSVYVIGPVNRGYSNWDIGTSSDALSDFRKWQHVNNASMPSIMKDRDGDRLARAK